jgi:hypothetical protein
MNQPLARALAPLPLHFCVQPEFLWPGVGENYDADIDELTHNPRGTTGAWLLRTYIELRRRGEEPTLSTWLRPDAINILDSFTLGRRHRTNDCFIVAARSDGPMTGLANFVIHQNGALASDASNASIPHWPQPGLIPREPSRGHRLERITFKGEPWNLDARFRTPGVLSRLAEMGMHLDIPRKDRNANASTWYDYKTSDAVIAVRNLTKRDAMIKPASKLVNAWIAGVPALLGPEPAYRELREGPLDYFEIRDVAGAMSVLQRLRDDPGLYLAVIENGRKRAADFTTDRMVQRWKDLIAGPIRESWQRWQRIPRPMRLAKAALMHLTVARLRRDYADAIKNGSRILD